MQLALFLLLQLSTVQTSIAKWSAAYLGSELNTKVSVEEAEVDFLYNLTLKQLYLEDQKQDTLLYIDVLKVGIDEFQFGDRRIDLHVDMHNAYYNSNRLKGESFTNDAFLYDFFFNEDQIQKEEAEWDIRITYLNLSNSQFHYHDYNSTDSLSQFNPQHIDLDSIDMEIEDISFITNELNAKVLGLSILADNQFHLRKLEGDLNVSNEMITLKNFKLATDGTALNGDFRLTADSFEDYNEFAENVHISLNIRNGALNTSEWAYFSEKLNGFDEQFFLDGAFRGTLSNFKSNRFEIYFDQDLYMSGALGIRGLPDIENTYVYFKVAEMNATASEIRKLNLPNLNLESILPPYLDNLGKIGFEGNFSGYYNDYVAFGSLNTDLGQLEADLYLKQDSSNTLSYEGVLASSGFELGQLLEIEDLGNVQFDWLIDGRGFKKNTAEAKTIGTIKRIVYKGYDYENMEINGNIAKGLFQGDLTVADDDLSFDFRGLIDLTKKIPRSEYSIDLKKANLAKLNLFNQKDSTTQLGLKAQINMLGFDLDEFLGSIDLKEINYVDKYQSKHIDSLVVISTKDSNQRSININSNLLDAHIRGQFQLKEFNEAVTSILKRHTEMERVNRSFNQIFELDIKFKDLDKLNQIVGLDLHLDSTSTISGLFDSEGEIQLSMSGKKLAYGGMKFDNFSMHLRNTKEDSLRLDVWADQYAFTKAILLDSFSLSSSLYHGENSTLLNWGNRTFGNYGQINLLGELESLQKMNFQFRDSYFSFRDTLWQFADSNSIYIDHRELSIDGISIGNSEQQIALQGQISDSSEQQLGLQLKEIDLYYLSELVGRDKLKLKGKINGSASINNVYRELGIQSNLDITGLFVNGIDIGESSIKSQWISDNRAFFISAILGGDDTQLLNLNGNVFPFDENKNYDLNLHLSDFPVKLLSKYIEEYLSDLDGYFDGQLKITGPSNQPQLYGNFEIKKTRFKINYLNTHYQINDKLIIRPDYIGLNAVKVIDSKGNKAFLTGTVFHENFSQFNFDLGLDMDRFYALNTGAKDNTLFYGQAYLNGLANISGYGDQLFLEFQLESMKGTSINIPMEGDIEVGNSDYLVFTNSPEYKVDKEVKTDLSGIQMSFDMNITPEAETRIIFDERIGDVLYTRGNGQLKMLINPLGDFSMLGEYEVQSGNYLFTLQNIVNKRFEIESGSKIFWDGDPYKARMDITAIYKTRAALKDLFPEDSTDAFRRRLPVDLQLKLSEYLLNPEINFDIQLQNVDDQTERRLQSILYVNNNEVNRQEMNQQVFGLLVFNRFMPPSNTSGAGGFNGGAAGANNGYEFLSNQLSNWLSNISDDFDVGLSYRPANEVSSQEVDLSLSTEILDGRVILDGSVGYSGRNDLNTNQTSSFIGEFSAEYKLSRDGRFRIRGFNRSTRNSLLQTNSPYTQGIGLFYREDFDSFNELWRKYFHAKKKSTSL